MAASPSLPQAGVLGEEGDVPHLVLPEVGREALLPVLPDVDGAREEVLVDGDDRRRLVAAPLIAADDIRLSCVWHLNTQECPSLSPVSQNSQIAETVSF